MTCFNEMKNLFKKMGLDFKVVEGTKFNAIDVLDSKGNKAKFSFDKNGYYDLQNNNEFEIRIDELENKIKNYIENKYNQHVKINILNWEDGNISIEVNTDEVDENCKELIELAENLGADEKNTTALIKEIFKSETITWKCFHKVNDENIYIKFNNI